MSMRHWCMVCHAYTEIAFIVFIFIFFDCSNIQWQKVGVGSVLNISDSNKFGVWETLPGWGMSEQEHISLLRIRDFGVRDLGTYQCHVTCEDRRGRLQHQYYYVDVCLKENDSRHSKKLMSLSAQLLCALPVLVLVGSYLLLSCTNNNDGTAVFRFNR